MGGWGPCGAVRTQSHKVFPGVCSFCHPFLSKVLPGPRSRLLGPPWPLTALPSLLEAEAFTVTSAWHCPQTLRVPLPPLPEHPCSLGSGRLRESRTGGIWRVWRGEHSPIGARKLPPNDKARGSLGSLAATLPLAGRDPAEDGLVFEVVL